MSDVMRFAPGIAARGPSSRRYQTYVKKGTSRIRLKRLAKIIPLVAYCALTRVTWLTTVILSVALGCRADRTVQTSSEPTLAAEVETAENRIVSPVTPQPWPSFRGINASGVADGEHPPLTWDAEKGVNIGWKTPIPGLGHSCPIVWGDRLFVI